MNDKRATLSNTQAELNKPNQKKRLNPLLIMILVFGLPYALAWYFMYVGDPTEFEAPNHAGLLISPMVPLPDYSLETIDGKQLSSAELANNWLLFTTSAQCKDACKRALLVMRQVRKAMAVDREVIKPILLLNDDNALAKLDVDLATEFQNLSIIKHSSAQASGLLEIFKLGSDPIENSIYMVDPYGNFMMAYPADSDQLGLLDDMKRLLKVNPVHK